MIELSSRRAVREVKSQFFDLWMGSDTFMNAIVKRTASSLLFIRPIAQAIKQNVNLTTYECLLTQLYAETGKVDKKAGLLHPEKAVL